MAGRETERRMAGGGGLETVTERKWSEKIRGWSGCIIGNRVRNLTQRIPMGDPEALNLGILETTSGITDNESDGNF